jgi:cytochrome c553
MAHPLRPMLALSLWLAVFLFAAPARAQLPTGAADFFAPGTKPGALTEQLFDPTNNCAQCHGHYDAAVEPYASWTATTMAQSVRDPIFRAAMSIANQDANSAGTLCLRCHAPAGYLNDHNAPDGSRLTGVDVRGVSCHVCHRMVNPTYVEGESPVEDLDVLATLREPVGPPGNGNFVIDPLDRRRGPIVPYIDAHPWLQSPFHEQSELCASCHEVSNPLYSRNPDGSYSLNEYNAQHPTCDKHDEFPLERTYSEWANSEFALGAIEMGGRYGGNETVVGTCQECHMPVTTGSPVRPEFGVPISDDVPRHLFAGANSWAVRAVRAMYDDSVTDLSQDAVADADARTAFMLNAASDLELSAAGNQLTARVINQTGHKLPTGLPEGRRVWLNVRFLDSAGALIAERGHYDPATATLTESDTKVYQAVLGLDDAAAQATGQPAGPSFHFALVNTRLFDNRIPPRGFRNDAFGADQCAPVGYAYPDGQYWDDTTFTAPPGAATAQVRVFSQTTSRGYAEFLHTANTTNDDGWAFYQQYIAQGQSEPIEMDFAAIQVSSCTPDFNGDGDVGTDADIEAFFACLAGNCCPTCAGADFNADGDVGTDADIEGFFRVLAGGNC